MTYAQWLEVGGLLVGVVGGREAIAQGLKWWAGYRERRAQAHEAAEAREEEREERTEARLWARLERVEKHSDECHDALAEQSSLNQTLLKANADCERRYDSLEARVKKAERASADITGKIELAAEKVVALRSTPVPPPMKRSHRQEPPDE